MSSPLLIPPLQLKRLMWFAFTNYLWIRFYCSHEWNKGHGANARQMQLNEWLNMVSFRIDRGMTSDYLHLFRIICNNMQKNNWFRMLIGWLRCVCGCHYNWGHTRHHVGECNSSCYRECFINRLPNLDWNKTSHAVDTRLDSTPHL